MCTQAAAKRRRTMAKHDKRYIGRASKISRKYVWKDKVGWVREK